MLDEDGALGLSQDQLVGVLTAEAGVDIDTKEVSDETRGESLTCSHGRASQTKKSRHHNVARVRVPPPPPKYLGVSRRVRRDFMAMFDWGVFSSVVRRKLSKVAQSRAQLDPTTDLKAM